jgi:hypothetical protein
MCKSDGMHVNFREYDYIKNKQPFEEKNINTTPTIEIVLGGKTTTTHVQDPKRLFDMVKSGTVVQYGGCDDKMTGGCGCDAKMTGGCGCDDKMMGGCGCDDKMTGGSNYYEKYMMYKRKYLALKMSL